MYQPIGYEHPFEGNRRNANGFGRYLLILPKRIKFVLYFASDAQKPEIPPGRWEVCFLCIHPVFFSEINPDAFFVGMTHWRSVTRPIQRCISLPCLTWDAEPTKGGSQTPNPTMGSQITPMITRYICVRIRRCIIIWKLKRGKFFDTIMQPFKNRFLRLTRIWLIANLDRTSVTPWWPLQQGTLQS